ncbi:MAG: tetratricopeptide repeat protein [Treponema sp.]|jgi:tetratricopeptide (TPR) repeat protein|nr:tetratricopeptide repeat protein [Treponema sp.]
MNRSAGGSFYRQAASKRSAAAGRRKLAAAVAAGTRRDYKNAVSLLVELISGYDAPPEAYLYLGRSFHALKDYSRALAAYNDYLRLRPRSSEGRLFAGRTYLAIGLPHRAVPLLRKALRLNPSSVSTMALLGTAYLKSKHARMAADLLQQAVETAAKRELAPGESRRIYRAYLNALFIRGIALCRRENFDLGMQMLRFVLENGRDLNARGVSATDTPLLRLELGRACRETGALREALEHYSRAAEYAPGDLQIRWYKASVLMMLGKNAETLEELAYIRSREKGNPLPDLPWNSRLVDQFMIRSFLMAGSWRRAAEVCRLWLKNREADPLIHAMYAEAQRNMGDFGAAANHLERALELDGERVELWYEYILVAWESKNWNKVKKILTVLQKLGGDPDLIGRFSVLYKAATGEDDKAIIGLLQKAIRRLGPEPELMYTLGERYLKAGLVEDSVSWFEKTLVLKKDHERARLGLIAALEALADEGSSGVRDRLLTAYNDYLDRWSDNLGIRRDRALFLIRICEFARAAEELEALLVWEPANPTLRRVLAYAYRKNGRYREAAVFLKALLKGKPGDIPLLLEFSGCLERAGAGYYARAVLEKAMLYFEKSPEIPMALGLLRFREKKIELSLDLLREAAGRNAGDPRPYQWMAVISRKIGDQEGARKFEEEAEKRKKIPVKG